MRERIGPGWMCAFMAFLMVAWGEPEALPPQVSADRSTPQRAMRTFFNFAVRTRPQHDFALAGEGLDLSQLGLTAEARRAEGARLAEMLLTALDAKGYYIDVPSLPDTPATEVAHIPIHVQAKELYLANQGGVWLLSADSVARIPNFYDSAVTPEVRWVIDHLPPVFRSTLLGVAWWQYTGLFVLLLVALGVKRIVMFISEHYLIRWAAKTRFKWDEPIFRAVSQPVGMLIFAGILAVGFPNLQFGVRVSWLARLGLISLSGFSVIWLVYRLVDVFASYLEHLTAKTDSKLDDQLVPIIRKTLKVFVIVIGAIFLLQNLDVNVGSLLAGLGLGGLAFALAAQDSISNLFGSVMILLDRPFQIGDRVVIEGVDGTVEEVGLRSTRVRTFYGRSLVTIPNSKLVQASIDNLGARPGRAIRETISLTYSTTPEEMEAFAEGVRQIVLANPHTKKEPIYVYFHQFGAASLDVLLYCHIDTTQWEVELRERHRLFLEIIRLASEIGVEFAFPTQTVHVDSFPGAGSRPMGKGLSLPELAARAAAFGPEGRLSRPQSVDLKTITSKS
ncbi:MAG: mechanosensitive ion channel family protein [Planctomycetes bacterium]|nr:mechanosensitive ion channel family protein [Planctomycetota bacterium]